jgi:pyrroloquinoline quinone biosynthesis protein E
MQEPCRSCSEKEKDFGGCRCQAFLLLGDAASTDPVCAKSPQHHVVTDIIKQASVLPETTQRQEHPLVFRTDKNSRLISESFVSSQTAAAKT